MGKGKGRQRRLTGEQQRLAAGCFRLACSLAKRAANYYALPLDDCTSAALYGLCRAALNFRPELGYQFSTYATYACRSRLAQLARQSQARQGREVPFSQMGALDLTDRRPAPRDYDAPGAERLIRHAGRDAHVLRLRFVRGLKLQEIGDRLGCTKERARQRQKRGIDAVRAAVGGKGADRGG